MRRLGHGTSGNENEERRAKAPRSPDVPLRYTKCVAVDDQRQRPPVVSRYRKVSWIFIRNSGSDSLERSSPLSFGASFIWSFSTSTTSVTDPHFDMSDWLVRPVCSVRSASP